MVLVVVSCFRIHKKGHDRTKIPYHPCHRPDRKERKVLGMSEGAVIECEVCGQWWRYQLGFDGLGWQRSPKGVAEEG